MFRFVQFRLAREHRRRDENGRNELRIDVVENLAATRKKRHHHPPVCCCCQILGELLLLLLQTIEEGFTLAKVVVVLMMLLLLFLLRNRAHRVDDDDDGQQGRLGLPCEHGILGAILEVGAKLKERHLPWQIDGSTWRHGGERATGRETLIGILLFSNRRMAGWMMMSVQLKQTDDEMDEMFVRLDDETDLGEAFFFL